MPKYYEPGYRALTQEEYEARDLRSPRFVWPAHRRVWTSMQRAGMDASCGDVLIIGDRRVVVLARDWMRSRYLVAPDSPTVGLNVAARVLGRILRRICRKALVWAAQNDLATTPENVIVSWRDLRLPWRYS